MSEAPEQIGIDPVFSFWTRDPHETDIKYIRADLCPPPEVLRQVVEALLGIDAAIFNDNGDITWSPLKIRSEAGKALAALRPYVDRADG